ncbi:McrC family protein [Aquimarina rhabdastrellae]
MAIIQKYEHDKLLINESGFTHAHWKAFVKLNTLHGGKYFEVLHNGLKFNQYVGVIQVDDLLVEICPKADRHGDHSRWQHMLIPMLKACNKIKTYSHGFAQVSQQNLNLLELYFELFLKNIEKLLRLGLIKKYHLHTQNTKVLKGKLQFAKHLQHNLIHQERFYTTHQVYDNEHLLHQVLYKALTIVKQYTHGTRLHALTHRIAIAFPIITLESTLNEKLFDTFTFNRKTAPYQDAFELAKLIILNHSPNIKGGKERMISLLFDMNQLWEEYIFLQLKKHLVNIPDYSVKRQPSKAFWKSKVVRPDIVITNNARQTTYIIDTKWKLPIHHNASIADLRQMYSYTRLWNAQKALLLYPGEVASNSFHPFKPKDIYTHYCKIGFATVMNTQQQLDTTIAAQIMNQLVS